MRARLVFLCALLLFVSLWSGYGVAQPAKVQAYAVGKTETSDIYPANGLVPVCVQAHYYACGLLDRQGQWRVEPKYSQIRQNGSRWNVERSSGLVGLLGSDGSTLIEPRFRSIGSFVNGLADARLPGRRDQLYGFINPRGEWVIQPQFKSANDFHSNAALVRLAGKNTEYDLALVDRTGKITALPYTTGYSNRNKDDRFIVNRDKGKDEHVGIIDGTGKVLLPFAPAVGLELIPGGGWITNEGNPFHTIKAHSPKGDVIFSLSGVEAWIDTPNVQGIAKFKNAKEHEGLINLRTGKIIIPAAQRSLGLVNDELIYFEGPKAADGSSRYGYYDLSGRQAIAPKLKQRYFFQKGFAAICNGTSKFEPNCEVIDHTGKPVKFFNAFNSTHITLEAWETISGEDKAHDIAKVFAEDTWFVTTTGKTIARIQKMLDCDREQVKNAHGLVIWPRYPEALCALRNVSSRDRPTDSALQPAFDERERHELEKDKERALIADLGGGPQNLLNPKLAQQNAELSDLPWVSGPANITLSYAVGSATFEFANLPLPEGYKYLAPEYYPQWQLIKGKKTNTDQPLVGLLAAPNMRWIASVSTNNDGYVNLNRPLQPANKLLSTLRTYQSKGYETDGSAIDSLDWSWAMEPALDVEHQRLAVASKKTVTTQFTRLRVARFGRTSQIVFEVQWDSIFQATSFQSYHPEVLVLADSAVFMPSRSYQDHSPNDIRAPYDALENIIAGPMSAHIKKVMEDENRKFKSDRENSAQTAWKGVFLLIALALLALRLVFKNSSDQELTNKLGKSGDFEAPHEADIQTVLNNNSRQVAQAQVAPSSNASSLANSPAEITYLPSSKTAPSVQAQAGGDVLDAMYGGGDCLYTVGEEALKKHIKESPKNRILIHHSARTKKDQGNDVFASMFLLTLLWGMTLLMVMVFFMQRNITFMDFVGAVMCIGFMGWMSVVASQDTLDKAKARSGNWGWERTKWIDLERRMLVVEFESFGKNPERQHLERPLDELILLGARNDYWEGAATYDVTLVDKAAHTKSLSNDTDVNYLICNMYMGSVWTEAAQIGEYLQTATAISFLDRLNRPHRH